MLYFVARTDITAYDGLQRVFGVYDTFDDAQRYADQLTSQIRGTFVVFEGTPVTTRQGAK